MKNIISVLFSSALIMLNGAISAQPKIIFDTDIGGDADDLGALAMLHHFVDRGECELMAVMCWSTEKYAVSAIDAINRFYGHPEIPIGTRKDPIHQQDWNYTKPIADAFEFKADWENVWDATSLYRKILANNADQNIIVVTVGPLLNIQNLINSPPDIHSPLNGKKLIKKKVKEFVIMGGKYPSGEKEWNFDGAMPGVTQFVIENLDVPIVFTGFEVGLPIKTGAFLNRIDKNTPLYIGYMHFSKHAQWMKENFQGKIQDNASFDQTAILYAVRKGIGSYWDKIQNGYCQPDAHGGNIWVEGAPGNHAYLRLRRDPENLARLIESIMLNEY